ncbi:RlmE family RNA methyltransferase [Candidatus Macondimonas diazotrophica]|jgi:23S rRNA (uridine2552-2'-O)-methyltransferase|uniref:Ribosomal RNA large subunit methyltransferase E n=1 Tax=Candidatus Macondimonas diazotrophica TaxID=2305248 RepID=A0A4Z0F969_9GAMM|nr:RlmE family RNA methyltransferase [Candidatus Macondimonas diazotrophica]MDY6956767.1 RlmE family RNA methyltransferase [Pseudomonadota bacterium]HBG32110.1 23S rRNA methyltransferase [Gammaproteobacteria bacterium]NCU01786.1 RlmE family RNA methyltransferase [Candidatus Macondimonas diazotrophica]TFZ82931.1 RlmE family RNA methyltransferase [Candidatus Macondimonas diazotrophica]HBG50866.1 23S rRNA methyltransferase [Gammaproteobacteria bacterium]
MPKRRKSSAAWLREHFSDPYVQRAKAEGWRSRAVYKLEEIDERDRLLRPGLHLVDLGAAPGGWSQYAARKVGPEGRVVAFDLLPITPLPGVVCLQGDFREREALDAVTDALDGRAVDLVLSDMAPNTSGVEAVDQIRSLALAEAAEAFAIHALRPGGDFLVKLFQGPGFDDFVRRMRGHFGKVVVRKPKASRERSPEVYLLARNYAL